VLTAHTCGIPRYINLYLCSVIYSSGFGYSDIENRVKMTPEKVLRIASISKSMTAAMLGKLWEEGKIDLDKPIQTYIPDFPKKKVEGKNVFYRA